MNQVNFSLLISTSGTDYTHPLLGGGFGPGHKVVGGFDFVGDAYNGIQLTWYEMLQDLIL